MEKLDLKDISIKSQILKKKAEDLNKVNLDKKYENLRPITDEEINEIVSIIPKLPIILVEVREDIYNKQIELIRSKLIDKLVPVTKDKSLRFIEFMKTKLEMHALKGYIIPGTPLGMNVSDDIGSGVMQGALNTRHKAGSRQNASGGLKVQREITALRKRSAPAVTIAFTQKETFYSIMTKWRALLVQVKVDNLIYDIKTDITVINRQLGDPEWYINYTNIFETEITKSQYALEIKIRSDILYIHKLTLLDVTNAINLNNNDKFYAIFSPYLKTGPVIHIIPNENDWLVLGSIIRNLKDITISGLPEVKDIVPIAKKVIDAIEEELTINNKYSILVINKKVRKLYGIGKSHIINLCRVSGILLVNKNQLNQDQDINMYKGNDYVVCHTPQFDLNLKIRENIVNRKLPVVDIVDNIIYLNKDDIPLYKDLLTNLKLNFKINDNNIIVFPPKENIKILEVINSKKQEDDKLELEYEKIQRENRIKLGSDSQISILRPPDEITDISKANTHYIAELVGGSLQSLLDLNLSSIDYNRSYSNYSVELSNILGIEAARTFLAQEILTTWANSDSTLQNMTIQTMIDFMTYRGFLTPFSTNGITSQNIGFMSKSTVSFAIKHINNAALNQEIDPMKSAPGKILVAGKINMGTGLVQGRLTASYTPIKDEDDTNIDIGDLESRKFENPTQTEEIDRGDFVTDAVEEYE